MRVPSREVGGNATDPASQEKGIHCLELACGHGYPPACESAKTAKADLAATNKAVADRAKAATVIAKSEDPENAILTRLEKNGCVTAGGYHFRIVQKLGANLYEIALAAIAPLGYNGAVHAVLQTTGTKFESTGEMPAEFYMKKSGTKTVATSDGFQKAFPLYEDSAECAKIGAPLWR